MSADDPRTLRVLLVEDNPGDVDLVRALMDDPKAPGCRFESTACLSAALDRLARGGLDVVLLDLNLPDARGLDAVVRLCAAEPHIAVVVLTGEHDEQRGIEAVQHGAQEYLVKGSVDGRALGRVLRHSIERKQAAELLRHAQKVESLGVMAGGVAHDFNNMLSTILGHATLALREMAADGPGRSHLEKVVRATNRATELTRQMLAYSGRGHFQVRTTRLNDLVRENLPLIEAAVPKNARVSTELGDELPAIDADTGQMQQVLMNLVLNGAEALEARPGTVTVGTRAAAGGGVELEVRDDGCGMDPRTASRIFDPFFTTKRAGRGLGLAAVQGIVRGHAATIRVASEPARGAVFTVRFPASTRAPVHVARATARPAPVRKGLVLVIDDDAELRETVAALLASLGFQVVTAEDGEAGAAVYAERRSDVQLVILDLSMPGWTGAETFHALRRLNPQVKVILTSGYSDEEACKEVTRRELAGFLAKPYGIAEIARELDRCLAEDGNAGGDAWRETPSGSGHPTSKSAGS